MSETGFFMCLTTEFVFHTATYTGQTSNRQMKVQQNKASFPFN